MVKLSEGRFVKLLSIFQKKSRPADAPPVISAEARMASYLAGRAPCENCGTGNAIAADQALCLVPCPQCGEPQLLPMRVAGFWLYSPLGAGGMGAVYKACHEARPTEQVAVKILPRDRRTDPLLIDSLQQEAAITRHFSGHPCVANL